MILRTMQQWYYTEHIYAGHGIPWTLINNNFGRSIQWTSSLEYITNYKLQQLFVKMFQANAYTNMEQSS